MSPPAIRVEMLPARLGDCLLVECARDDGPPWRMLVDGGPPDTWPLLERRLARLDDPRLDVVVITHIDSDHIGGMVPFMSSEYAAQVGDFWFNGRTHLPGDESATRSVKQGESVVAALLGEDDPSAVPAVLPWNLAFGGGAIEVPDDDGFVELTVPGGPRITLLSPTGKRLRILAAGWYAAVEAVTRGEDRPADTGPDLPIPLDDLAALAGESSAKDTSAPNGSSIGFLLEHRGASVILAGDAFGNVLGAGLARLAEARGQQTLPVDAFKLPHHGSRANVLTALAAVAPARHYLVSSNGDTFRHPDDAALARAVLASPDTTLWFNYRNERTERWADPAVQDRYRFSARYPGGDSEAGVVLDLPAR